MLDELCRKDVFRNYLSTEIETKGFFFFGHIQMFLIISYSSASKIHKGKNNHSN